MLNDKLILFSSTDGDITVDVQLSNDTVWLSQKQIEFLFGRDQSVISRHIKNIFKDELDEKSNMHFLHIANSDKPVAFYNLDVIISVGYRVKSKRGVEFRRWANAVLKEYLLKGYALNNNILDKTHNEYQNLLGLLNKTLINNQLITEQGQNIISLINEYTVTWSSLLQYDEDKLAIPNNTHKTSNSLSHGTTIQAIAEFKSSLINIGEATPLFGNERNDQLQSILSNLDQTMFGEELYKSVEEKAANLFYMVIKDHPFSDGNKRIGSFLFLLYIQLNKLPLKIDNIGLTSLALLIAESDPKQKDLLIRLIINLLVIN
ncbi:MAG: virulence protein RhuM/Fic/DOC family protein [Burkholderiales bacterium]|jgi:DNA ligase (NAD+)|nr:virulence protein RhuM/Fic/DOC family protein [Burkholderiales bacterium]